MASSSPTVTTAAGNVHRSSDEESDLYLAVCILVQRFLESGPYRQSAVSLRRELELSGAFSAPTELANLLLSNRGAASFASLPGDQLLQICRRFVTLVGQEIPLTDSMASTAPSLLRNGRHSVFRTRETTGLKIWGREDLLNCPLGSPKVASGAMQNRFNPYELNFVRRLTGRPFPVSHYSKSTVGRFEMQIKTIGHIAPVTCILFDPTSKYLFTGAEDGLVKVWLTDSGRLLYTFRYLRAGVTDLELDEGNRLLAISCRRGSLSVWNLQNGRLNSVISTRHSGSVFGISFVPYHDENKRYLVSVGVDGCVCFHKWLASENRFGGLSDRFSLKLKNAGRLTNIACSEGGQLVAVCGSGCATAIFYMFHEQPTLVELVSNVFDPVVWISWGRGLRLLTCTAKNGVVRVWQFQRQVWKHMTLNMKQNATDNSSDHRRVSSLRAKCAVWNCNSTRICVTCMDGVLRIFEPIKGTLLRSINTLSIVAGLELHPVDPDIIAVWSVFGKVFLYNVAEGTVLFENEYRGFDFEEDAICGALFSPDGNRLCTIGHGGQLILYGAGKRRPVVPAEQFFHDDYILLLMDSSGFSLEEQDELLHRSPPPFLVTRDGVPYPPEVQRLVPGRETCPEELLTPNISLARTTVWFANQTRQVSVPRRVQVPDVDDLLESCWLRRTLVPPLEQSMLDVRLAKVKAISEDEVTLFTLENAKDRIVEPVVEPPRRRPSRPENVPEIPPDVPYDSDNELDPDYTEAVPTHVTRRAGGIRTRQSNVNTDSDDESSASSTSDSDRTSDNGDDDESESVSDESDEADVDGPRNRRRRQAGGSAGRSRRRRMGTRRTVADRSPTPMPDVGAAPEAPPTFSDWITCTSNRTFPYFPQKGDEVVYFRQGHELYVRAVQANNVYRIRGREMPWQRVQLNVEEVALVEEISFRLAEVRLCRLVLRRLGPDGVAFSGGRFVVQFHDMAEVADFIVLRQFYVSSLRRTWRPRDQFQTLIDDNWWTGTVVRKQPFDAAWPDSNFQCLVVVWEDGSEERLSPWDILPVMDNRDGQTCLWKYQPTAAEWPPAGLENECRRLATGIQALINNHPFCEPFAAPVDLDAYPIYATIIEYPSDLRTIKQRLDSHYYRRLESVKSDVLYISKNAHAFNLPLSLIVVKADLVTRVLLSFIDSPNVTNIGQTVRQCRAARGDDAESAMVAAASWFGQMPAAAGDWQPRFLAGLRAMRQTNSALYEQHMQSAERSLHVNMYHSAADAVEDVQGRLTAMARHRGAQHRDTVQQMREAFMSHITDLLNSTAADQQQPQTTAAAGVHIYNTRSSGGGGQSGRPRHDSVSSHDRRSTASSSTQQPVDPRDDDDYVAEDEEEEEAHEDDDDEPEDFSEEADADYVEQGTAGGRSRRLRRRVSVRTSLGVRRRRSSDEIAAAPVTSGGRRYELRRKRPRRNLVDDDSSDQDDGAHPSTTTPVAAAMVNGADHENDDDDDNDDVIVTRSSRGRLIRRRRLQ